MTFEEFETIVNECVGKYTSYASSYSEEDGFRVDNGTIEQWHITGGASGGNCWGDSAESFVSSHAPQEFLPLDDILMQAKPYISFLEYRKLTALIKHGKRNEHEYYGNYNAYRVSRLDIRELYDALDL